MSASATSAADVVRAFTSRAIARAESLSGSTSALLGDDARNAEVGTLNLGRVLERDVAREDRLRTDRVLALHVARRYHLRGRRDVLGIQLRERVDMRH